MQGWGFVIMGNIARLLRIGPFDRRRVAREESELQMRFNHPMDKRLEDLMHEIDVRNRMKR